MAIYKLIQNVGFEPKDTERLVTAYEQTLHALRLKDRSDPITQLVAEKIIAVGRLALVPNRSQERSFQSTDIHYCKGGYVGWGTDSRDACTLR
jgi:hypothetical protein